MRTSAAHIVCGIAAVAVCLLLWGCDQQVVSTAQNEADNTQYQRPVVTITQIEPEETDEQGNKKRVGDGNTKTSGHDILSSCLGTIAKKVADDHGNPLVERDTVRELFTFTIEDEDYELPCPIAAFMDKEWIFEQGYTFEDQQYDPDFSFDVGLWHKGDENYNLNIKLKNTTDEIVGWNQLTVVGLTLRPLDSYVSFASKGGVDRDSNLDDLLSVLGCNDESALLENKTIVEYHVSLYEKPFYDMNASLYANISYDWNKTGKAMTSISFELLDPWDVDLRKSDEELDEEREKSEEEAVNENPYVGRTVEGV